MKVESFAGSQIVKVAFEKESGRIHGEVDPPKARRLNADA